MTDKLAKRKFDSLFHKTFDSSGADAEYSISKIILASEVKLGFAIRGFDMLLRSLRQQDNLTANATPTCRWRSADAGTAPARKGAPTKELKYFKSG